MTVEIPPDIWEKKVKPSLATMATDTLIQLSQGLKGDNEKTIKVLNILGVDLEKKGGKNETKQEVANK